MDQSELTALLPRFKNCRVGVMGDYCIDAYWMLDTEEREISIETGKPTHAVRSQRYTLGGAGNIVANLAALEVGTIRAFGVVGNDLFGREMRNLLRASGVDDRGMITQGVNWDTAVYSKPYLGAEEQERIDFGRFNEIADETAQLLIAELTRAVHELDLLILNRQLTQGVYTSTVFEILRQLAKETPSCTFLLDFRQLPAQFSEMVVKLNAREAARFCGESPALETPVSLSYLEAYARKIHQQAHKPVVITRGVRGLMTFDGKAFYIEPGIQILGKTDTVGAGDSSVAALGASLASGISLDQSARIANFAACVTIQKLKQTGTASPSEIIAVGSDPDYLFRPELARDIHSARYLKDTHVEAITRNWEKGQISHVVFDHDGTISVLREGWEAVMEPMMMGAILGKQRDTLNIAKYQRIADYVRSYIDQSTGIQTILQMETLVRMIREFGYVPESGILDATGYKHQYNEALMQAVNLRKDRITQGELTVEGFTIKGAVDMLKALHERGIRLYLASGTDEADVKAEAALLGYAHLFDGGIFGAVGDITKYSKKMVIDRIIREHNLRGAHLLTLGDGPVEIRETQKRGGITVGVASNEGKRSGLNPEKRTRLIEAGADLIIPDFSEYQQLLSYLFS